MPLTFLQEIVCHIRLNRLRSSSKITLQRPNVMIYRTDNLTPVVSAKSTGIPFTNVELFTRIFSLAWKKKSAIENFMAMKQPDTVECRTKVVCLLPVKRCNFIPISRTTRFFQPIFVFVRGWNNRDFTVVSIPGNKYIVKRLF